MSNEAQGLVRNLAMSAPHKPVLMAYANYADEAGYCWPGVETIAFDTGYVVQTVVKIRHDLIAQGWLATKRRFGTSAITRLNLSKMAAEAVDRGERTQIKQELEFDIVDSETAGHAQTAPTELNDSAHRAERQNRRSPRTAPTELNDSAHRPERQRPQTCNPSVDPSVDPSVPDAGARETAEPADAQGTDEGPDGETDGLDEKKPQEPTPTPLADHQRAAAGIVSTLDLSALEPTRSQISQITSAVASCLAAGVEPATVARHARQKASEARTVKYFLAGLAPEHLPAPMPERPRPVDSRTGWCGKCDPLGRLDPWSRLTLDTHQPCPTCHPHASKQPTVGVPAEQTTPPPTTVRDQVRRLRTLAHTPKPAF